MSPQYISLTNTSLRHASFISASTLHFNQLHASATYMPQQHISTTHFNHQHDSTTPPTVLMVEVYSEVEDVMRYYGNDSVSLAHFPFNFFMLEALNNRSTLTGYDIKDTISLWLDNMPEGKWPNWVLGNHDNGRVASRLGKDMVDALNMVVLLLPGTPLTYNGEEIGTYDSQNHSIFTLFLISQNYVKLN
ncbi:Maltase A3 [Portunus trituberculatus]|uniref:Maltase A3 n=1 Tax=Portunus trituberculatus TaxID=210409 RepID=A0A5B7GJ34_PORTR|nr:Maltase A3 [Portunus trituberculatus]